MSAECGPLGPQDKHLSELQPPGVQRLPDGDLNWRVEVQRLHQGGVGYIYILLVCLNIQQSVQVFGKSNAAHVTG